MKIIENITRSGVSRAFTYADEPELLIRNCQAVALVKNPAAPADGVYGFDIRRCGTVDFEDVTILAANGIDAQYAYGVRLGYSNEPAQANTLVRMNRVKIGNFGPPVTDYSVNRDMIVCETGTGALWVKDSFLNQGSGASDACIDCKLKTLSVARTQFGPSYRLLRIWPGVTVTLSECSLMAPVTTIWFGDKTAKLTVYKTNGITQANVTGQGMSNAEAFNQIQFVTANPLAEPWFAAPGAPPVTQAEFNIFKAEITARVAELEKWRKS